MSQNVESIANKFTMLGRIGMKAMDDIASYAYYTGKRLVKSLSIDQITAGWTKYGQKTSSVQTIMNATGDSIETVNGYLDKLMWFSDETSYNFTEMTAALGTLTSSGGKVEKLIPMIEGMATATAFAGKTASEFSRVIYNLNQSYSQGYLSLMDWKSVELAQVGSEQLKQTLIDTAVELGTLKKASDGTYKTLKGTLVTAGNMGSTLNEKWATREVMEGGFGKFASVMEEAYKLVEAGEFDTASDAIASLEGKFDDIYFKAAKAAQEAKSFGEAIEATKDAVSSGWMKSFELIFGNYEEAKEMWTDLANALWDVFASGGEARNEMLQAWHDAGGRADLLQGIYDALEGLWGIVLAVKDAFADIFPPITVDTLLKMSSAVKEFGANLKYLLRYRDIVTGMEEVSLETPKEELEEFNNELKKGSKGDDVKKLQERLTELGYDVGPAGTDGIFGPKTLEALKKFQEDYGMTVDGIYNSDVHSKLGEALGTGEKSVSKITKYATILGPVLKKLKSIASGVFAVFKMGWTILKFVGKAFGKIAYKILGPFADAFLTIGAALGDWLTGLSKSMDASTKFTDWLEKLDKYLEPVSEWCNKAADAMLKFFGLGGEVGDDFLTFAKIWEKIKAIFSGKDTDGGRDTVEKVGTFMDRLKNIFRGFKAWFKANIDADSFLSNFDSMDLIITAAGILSTLIIGNVLAIVNNIRKTFSNIKKASKALKDFVSGFRNTSRINRISDLAASIMKFAIAVAILVGAIWVLSKMSPKELITGLAGLLGIVLVLAGGIVLMKKAAKGFKGMEKAMAALMTLSLAVAMISVSVRLLGTLSGKDLVKGLVGVFVLLAQFVLLLLVLKKIKKVDTSALVALGVLAAALLSITKVVVILGSMDFATLAKGLISLGIVMYALSLFLKELAKVKISKRAILALIPTVLAIDMLILGFAALALLMKIVDTNTLIKAFLSLSVVILALVLFLDNMENTKPNTKAILALIPTVLAIDALILGFAALVLLVKFIDAGTLVKAFVSLGLVMASILIFMKMLEKVKPNIGAILALIPVALAIDALVLGFAILAITMKIVDTSALNRAFAALVFMLASLGVFMYALNQVKPNIRAVLALIPVALAIDALILGFAILAKTMKSVDTATIVRTFAAFGFILAMFAMFMEALKTIKPRIGAVLSMVPAALAIGLLMVAFGYVLKSAKDAEPDAILRVGAAMTAIIATLALVMLAGSKMSIRTGVGMLIGCIGLVAVIAALAIALKSIQDIETEKIITFIGGVISLMVTMTALCLIAGLLGGAATMVMGALGIGAAFAIIVGIVVAVVTLLGAINKLTGGGFLSVIETGGKILEATGKAIGSFIGGFVSGLLDPISGALKSIAEGLAIIDSIDDLEGALAKAMYAIETLGNFTKDLAKTGVERNRGALVKFFAGDNKTNSLLDQIKKFGETLRSVFEALGGIGDTNFANDVEVALGAARAIADFLVELEKIDITTKTSVFDKWFGGDSKQETILALTDKFGATMKDVADNLRGCSDYDLVGATETAINSAEKIKDFLVSLEGVDITTKTSVFDKWFGGDSTQETILSLTEQFGEAMGTIVSALNGTQDYDLESATEAAVNSAKKIKGFMVELEKVDITTHKTVFGDWFSGESSQEAVLGLIEQFGTSMQKVAEAMKATEGYDLLGATTAAVGSAEQIKTFLEKLGEVDIKSNKTVFEDWFSGESSQEAVLNLIKQFGTSMQEVAAALNETKDYNLSDATQKAVDSADQIKTFLEKLGEVKIDRNATVFGDWLSGKNKQKTVLELIEQFGKTLEDIIATMKGTTEYDFDGATDAAVGSAEKIRDFVESLNDVKVSKENKTVFGDWLSGKSKEKTVLELIKQFGTSMQEVVSALGGEGELTDLDAATDNGITAAEKIKGFLESLATIDIENKSGLEKWFTGENRQDTFLGFFDSFVSSISGASSALSGLSDSNLEKNITIAGRIIRKFALIFNYINSDAVTMEDVPADMVSKFDEFIGQMTRLGSTILEFNDTTKDIDLEHFSSIIGQVNGLIGSMSLTSTDGMAGISSAIDSLTTLFGKNGKNTLSNDNFLEGLDAGELVKDLNAFTEQLGTALSSDSGTLIGYANSFTEAGAQLGSAMASGMGNNVDTSGAIGAAEACLKAVKGYTSRFQIVGGDMVRGLANGLRNNAWIAKNAAKKVAEDTLNSAKEAIDSHSPSKKFEELGMYSDQGFAIGLSKYSKVVSDASKNVATTMLDSAKGGLSTLNALVTDSMDGDPVVRPVIDLSDVQSGAKTINGLFGNRSTITAKASIDNAAATASSIAKAKSIQNGSKESNADSGITNTDSSVNLSGNNFYVRSEQDIHSLASEIAALTRQQQRGLGAGY